MTLEGFATRLRALRDGRGWTQEALAQASGLTQMWISHFECGRRLPCAENLRALCVALGCSADYLLGLDDASAVEEAEARGAARHLDEFATWLARIGNANAGDFGQGLLHAAKQARYLAESVGGAAERRAGEGRRS